MAWKMIGKPKVTKLENKIVEQFSTMLPCPGDRPLNPKRAARIRHLLSTDQFRTCEWASVKCAEDGNTYRVNGKHTSAMLAEMNGTMPKNLFVVIEEYECDTLDDVAKLYATFDARDSVRTTNDINHSFAGCNSELAELPRKLINLAVTGIAYEQYEDSYCNVRPEDRAAKLLEYGDFVIWLHEVLGGMGRDIKHVCRGGCVAAMFRTWKKSQKGATEFWEAVRDGSGPDHKKPDRVLNKLLLRCSVNIGGGAKAGRERITSREVFVKCLHAWNAWRSSALSDLKYYAKAESPKAK